MAEYARSMDKRRHAEDRRAVAKAYVARIHAAAAITSDDAIDERRRAAARREEAHALMMRRALDVEQGDDGACAKAIAREAAVAVGVAAAEANRAAAAARLAMASICSNDPDLRDLSAKLHLASISRERSQQVALRLRMADDERAAVASVDAVAEAMRAAAVAAERAAVDARRNGGGTVRVQLEAQLADKAVRGHIEAVGKAASERALVEAILEKIRTEDAIALATKTATRNATAAAIEGYQAARATAIASAAATEREEVARIEAHARVAASRVAAAECTRAAEKTIRDAAYHAVVGEQEAARTAVEYEENLRWVLADAEAEKARAVSVAAQRASAERVKREVQADLDEQRRCVGEIEVHVQVFATRKVCAVVSHVVARNLTNAVQARYPTHSIVVPVCTSVRRQQHKKRHLSNSFSPNARSTTGLQQLQWQLNARRKRPVPVLYVNTSDLSCARELHRALHNA